MDRIKNQNLFCFHKNNLKKREFTQIYNRLKFLLILLFHILFNETYEQFEIGYVVQHEFFITYINSGFYKTKSDYKLECGTNLCNLTIIFDTFIETCEMMFSGLDNIIELDISNFDTSKVKNMAEMFAGCSNLEKITFGNINTSSVKRMDLLFHGCSKLKTIDISNFDTSSVTDMYGMFSDCVILTSVDVSNFNTKNVQNMFAMFADCHNLTSLNLSNFDTSKVKSMQKMFSGNNKLTYLDLSNFDINSVTNMKYMFEESNFLYLNLYSFVFKRGTEIDLILDDTPSKLKICINDLNTRSLLASYGKEFDCSDICIKKNLMIDLQYKRCVKNCNESNYKYEYNNKMNIYAMMKSLKIIIWI